jgi:hypothetical protein
VQVAHAQARAQARAENPVQAQHSVPCSALRASSLLFPASSIVERMSCSRDRGSSGASSAKCTTPQLRLLHRTMHSLKGRMHAHAAAAATGRTMMRPQTIHSSSGRVSGYRMPDTDSSRQNSSAGGQCSAPENPASESARRHWRHVVK